MQGVSDPDDPSKPPTPLVEEELVVNILSRAYALGVNLAPGEVSAEAWHRRPKT